MAINFFIKPCVKPIHIHIYSLDKKFLFKPLSRATVKDLLDAENAEKDLWLSIRNIIWNRSDNLCLKDM